MDKMLVINLFGSPNAGKSTFAASLFVSLKKRGIPAELVGEKTKELLYSGAIDQMENQFYLTALQYKKLKDLERSKTKVCISDSPLLLQLLYGQDLHYADKLNSLAIDLNTEFINYNALITRESKYSTHGRYHTEQESKEIEKDLLSKKNLLNYNIIVKGNDEGLEELTSNVLFFLDKQLNVS